MSGNGADTGEVDAQPMPGDADDGTTSKHTLNSKYCANFEPRVIERNAIATTRPLVVVVAVPSAVMRYRMERLAMK